MKTWFFVVQTRYAIQRIVQDSVHIKTAANTDDSIKSGIWAALRRLFGLATANTQRSSVLQIEIRSTSHSVRFEPLGTLENTKSFHRNSTQRKGTQFAASVVRFNIKARNITPIYRLVSNLCALLHPQHAAKLTTR